MVTTWRLITPVIAIRPTFWLNEVFGNPPKTPATAVPSAIGKGRALDLLVGRFAPGAAFGDPRGTSPTVSIAETMAMKHMPMMMAEVQLEPPMERGSECAKRPARSTDVGKADLPHDQRHKHSRR
jgi:hypothetical protein